MAGDEAGQHVV